MLTVQHLAQNHFDQKRLIENYCKGMAEIDHPISPNEDILKRSGIPSPVSRAYENLALNYHYSSKAFLDRNDKVGQISPHYASGLIYPMLTPIDSPFALPWEHIYLPAMQNTLLHHSLLAQQQNALFQTPNYLLRNTSQFHQTSHTDPSAVRVQVIQPTPVLPQSPKSPQHERSSRPVMTPKTEERKIKEDINEQVIDYSVPKTQKVCKRKLSNESESGQDNHPTKRQQLAYTCNVCPSSYKHRFELNRHIKVSHVRPHKCVECDKGFGHKNYLRIHIETVHKGLKSHKCEYCGKHLSTGGNLSVHIKTIHMGEKKYQCTICNRSFGQQCNMKTHMKRHEKNGENVEE